MSTSTPPDTPCLKICGLDQSRSFCLSCKRTLAEIAGWGQMSADQKRDLMNELAARQDVALPDLFRQQMNARRASRLSSRKRQGQD